MALVFAKVPLEEIEIGMEESFTKEIKAEDVEQFAEVSGDTNPIHLDDAYASQSRFKKRMAHGMMSASYFSALFGTKIPGEGCVYVSQSLKFKKPVYIGDTVVATVRVFEVDLVNRRVFFKTECKVKNRLVIDGEAELYVPKDKK